MSDTAAMNDFQNLLPKRTSWLEINPMPDGYMIYDPSLERIHYLNPASALILELCDGSTSVKEIAAAVADSFGLSDTPIAATESCVEKLMIENLVHS
ncbi:PqqD family protein [Brevundimonas naejangsanensis]|jgi:hypothetical protein|uniref:PqqD family protein n=1 Tax=Brevundimonas naejangsanensis TaxID=588932 RepID=UPI003D006D1A